MAVKKESTTKAKKTTTKKVEAKNTAPKEFETLYTQDIPDLDITDNESYLQGISVVRKRHEKNDEYLKFTDRAFWAQLDNIKKENIL